MAFELAGLTDVGRKRDHNEDSLLLLPGRGVAVIADGMGGHNAGEVASAIAVKTVETFFNTIASDPDATWPFRSDARFDESANRLLVAIQLANAAIREASHVEGQDGMGTTVVAALLEQSRAYVAWLGDSRAYSFREGLLSPITVDHSLQNELLRTARIRPQDIAGFQHKNVITRALGMAEKVESELRQVELQPDEILLLCSDGLTTMLADAQIAEILAADADLETAVRKLVDATNAAGGFDNVTVVLARYKADPPSPVPTA